MHLLSYFVEDIKVENYNVIELPLVDELEELRGLENWQGDYYYCEKEDWEGLVKLRRKLAWKSQDDIHAQISLGEAYVLNNQYDIGLKFFRNLHFKYPDISEIQHYILDILFKTNRTENDFEWIQSPEITRLNNYVSNFCFEFLINKRKPRTIDEIYIKLMIKKGYLTFTEEQLHEHLIRDSRFELKNIDNTPYFTGFKVRRKR